MTAEERHITPAYIWFDSEFTSLEPRQARLLQVAMLVTDPALHRMAPVARDVDLSIALEADAPVSPWVAQHLAGLLARCRSEQAVSVAEADRRLARAVDDIVGPPAPDITRRPILAGNSVYNDLTLVQTFLPAFAQRLHYRLLDVSALKILWNDWSGAPLFDKRDDAQVRRFTPAGLQPPAAAAHDAYYDLHASLAELNYYRQQLLTKDRP